MIDKYFYVKDNKVNYRKRVLVDAIGFNKYCKWKQVQLFEVSNSLNAMDFLATIYSNTDSISRNPTFCAYLIKRLGLTDSFITNVYCSTRNIECEIKGGQYVVYSQVGSDPKDIVCGYGPSILMAIGNLYYEMSTSCDKTFIP